MSTGFGADFRTIEKIGGIKIDFATKNRHSVTASDIFPRELRVPSTPNYTTLPAEELFHSPAAHVGGRHFRRKPHKRNDARYFASSPSAEGGSNERHFCKSVR